MNSLNTVLLLGCLSLSNTQDPLVTTKSGPVRGTLDETDSNKLFSSFLSIPYASPPIGDLRFQSPQPVTPWTETLNATELPPSCIQRILRFGDSDPFYIRRKPSSVISEDCLFLNVWVPHPRPINASVMVHIHGGGYSIDSSNLPLYDGSIIATEGNVIVVNFNYRLGALGFLYLDHPDIAINRGLMDQTMALKWVKENIESFGGNPESITIVGQSAGSACVGVHLTSSVSRNYFSRAIMQSGSPIAPWATAYRDEALIQGNAFVQNLRCLDQDRSNVVQCLRKATVEDLISSEPYTGYLTFAFMPVLEGEFLDKTPMEKLSLGDFKTTDLLIGYTLNEASGFMAGIAPEAFTFNNKKLNLFVEDMRKVVETVFEKLPTELQDKIMSYYLTGTNASSEDILESTEQMFSDANFVCPTNKFAEAYASKGSRVFHYRFSQRSTVTFFPKWMGVRHGQDHDYIMGEPLTGLFNYTQAEIDFSKEVIGYWTRFAKTGDPNEYQSDDRKTRWPTLDLNLPSTLELKAGSNQVVPGLRTSQCMFWSNLI